MTSAIFAFLALETYANEGITHALRDGTYSYKLKKDVQELTAPELERIASTSEKLGDILPNLLNELSPKSLALWSRFLSLKQVRDGVTHLKSRDSNPRITDPSKLSDQRLFAGFLEAACIQWPRTAVELIGYFAKRSSFPSPWSDDAKQRIATS